MPVRIITLKDLNSKVIARKRVETPSFYDADTVPYSKAIFELLESGKCSEFPGLDLRGRSLHFASMRSRSTLYMPDVQIESLRITRDSSLRINMPRAKIRTLFVSDSDVSGSNFADMETIESVRFIRSDLTNVNIENLTGSHITIEDCKTGGFQIGGTDIQEIIWDDIDTSEIEFGPVHCMPCFVVRSDGYKYCVFTSVLGGVVIRAGCRTWSGPRAFDHALKHIRTTTDERYRPAARDAITLLRREFARWSVENYKRTVGNIYVPQDDEDEDEG